ncbi:hypothetical protein LCGC14_0994210 [marine sediment metagenome]|uniref:Uncharacterized protein n=1 Tax=marine sediment metagenome TaxID=412755 RepID=A0A0F9N4X7_9ZZZZ
MVAKTRCKECRHKRGLRSTANLTKTEPYVAKKKACECACHEEGGKP